MELRIINARLKNIGNKDQFECFVHLETLAEITEDQATMLIVSSEGYMFFDKPVSGKILIDYPLSVKVELEIKDCSTFGSIVWQIAKAYEEIYKQEASSSKINIVPNDERVGLINRNKTNGTYGIWGHDLGDLTLTGLEIFKNGNINLHISS